MTSLALASKLPSINARTRVAKAAANFLTGLPQKLVRTTRAGLATCIGPDGTLQWGPHNLLWESNNFLAWANNGVTPATSKTQFGNTQATLLTESTAATYHESISLNCSFVAGQSYILQAKLKPDSATSYQLYASGAVVSGCYANFNLSTGAVGTNGAGCTAGISLDPVDGMYLCWIRFTSGATVNAQFGFAFNNNNPSAGINPNYAGTGKALYVANAQLENVTGTNRTTPSEYVDSTVKNRLGYSNDFANAVWSKHGATMQVYEKTCTGPNGQPATTLVAGSANAEIHQSCTLAGVYTAGFLIRRRLGTGAISLRNSSNSTWLPQPITTDWAFYQNDGGTSGGTAYCDLLMATAGDQIDICDARLVPGTSAANYSYNPGPAPTPGPVYGQRMDHDVSTVTGIGPDLLGGAGLFDSGTGGFTGFNSTISASNGALTVLATDAYAGATKAITCTVGKAYKVTGTLITGVAGPKNTFLYIGTNPNTSNTSNLGGRQYSGNSWDGLFVATATTHYVSVQGSSLLIPGDTYSVDNITVQEAFSGKIAGVLQSSLPATAAANFTPMTGTIADVGGELELTSTSAGVQYAEVSVNLSLGKVYVVSCDAYNKQPGTQVYIGGFLNNVTQYYGGLSATTKGPMFFVLRASTTGQTFRIRFDSTAVGQRGVFSSFVCQEVQFAPRGALIEPTQVTQLLANPDDLSASPWGGSIACTDDGTKFRGRRFWKCAKTTTGTSEYRQNTGASFASGYFTGGLAFLASSNCAFVDFGLLGGTSTWGNAGDTTCSIDSGPGTLIQVSGGLWRLSGLSTNVPTVVTVVRNLLVAETASVFVYPDGTGSTTIGKAIYVQVDNLEAGTSPTSFIPNPATSGTVVRVADTSSVGYDDLCKALPWLMDTNALTNPEDQTLWAKVGATAPNANTVALGTGNLSYSYKVSSTAGAVGAVWTGCMLLSGTPGAQCYLNIVEHGGVWPATTNLVTLTATPTIYTVTRTLTQNGDFDLRILDANQATTVTVGWAKLNPGPVAQTYYPQSSKQGTILFEGDAIFGAGTISTALVALENGASNRVLHYFTTGGSFKGFVNATSATLGFIASGAVFKSVVGFSPSSAGTALNGSAESAITASAFVAAPNVLKIGNDASGNAASSMHIRRLRIFSTNLPASTKQALTR